MFKSFIPLLTGVLALSSSIWAEAQDKKPATPDPKKWQVEAAHGPAKEVSFTTTEGTWMNLDVSPDGKEIIFDILGDIYSLPITGGTAKLLAGGRAYEVQPRYSPDGKFISYTSDKDGGDNIWIMNRDGSNARAVTKENFRLLNNASWSPDGQYLIARKHFTATRSLGAGEMWAYHIAGGTGIQLTKRKNDQQDAGEPIVSPDGRYVYYSEDMSGGNFFEYNKDPNGLIYMIRRVDRNTGDIENVVTGMGGAVRPQLSRDGKLLAFVRRVRTKSVLYLHNLSTGEEWPVYDNLSKDQQEAWAIFGVYPNFAWTPDNKNIIIWAQGKIHKVDVSQLNKATEIPFTVQSRHQITEAVKYNFGPEGVAPKNFTAKAIRHAVTSPDGKYLVFSAAGYLYKKQLPNGKPARVTKGTDFEYYPAFSPDGKTIAYATWNDQTLSALYKTDLNGSKPQKLTTEKGFYAAPSFSPDGQKIIFNKTGGNDHQGYNFGKNTGIFWMPAKGGSMNLIQKNGSEPLFDKTGKRIFFTVNENGNNTLKSVGLDGKEPVTHLFSKYATQFVPSPDNQWVAFTELFNAYIMPLPAAGKGLEISIDSKAIPLARVSRDAGTSLHWSRDSQKLHWLLGEEYFTNDLKNRFTFLPGAVTKIPPLDSTGLKINLVLATDVPQGKLAFTNARIITMKGDEVIQNGTLVVEGNRIVAVGSANQVTVPAGTKTIDAQGKTIMPGLVDVHAHMGTFRTGMSPQQQWAYYANLAYGVTTTHDPSSSTEQVFNQSEMVKAGAMVGPRIFSTGTVLYGADGNIKAVINSLEDARSHLRRIKAMGGFSVKSYNQPRREQRQQVIQAARELGMAVVPEGGSTFFHNMTMILDGHTGIEHNIPIAPLYNDVVSLWKNSQTAYTPTLIVNYGANSGEYYWYQKTNVWEKERLLRFVPRSFIDSRSRRVTQVPDEEYANGHLLTAQACKKLADQGVKINLGAHGQLQGLGAHWELWMLQQGGMSNHEALRAATLNGAHYLSMEKEIGSLETGKLADLIVLDKNPLENIQNSESVVYTMINGRLYDAATMQEIGNYNKKPMPFYWENPKVSGSFPFTEGMDVHTLGIAGEQCSCHGRH
ncbi:bifunctional TolB-family protein/amidohydrolase [Adhaeribacter aerolatus]|uniref:Bifunctional TolB-family protein/amidohydrolase n=1 Tax=Adhaeribacter aerolatus TaxID=670289 RepID=A0A512B1N1_9BACT|nr:amidohydrolase family protein [Adhaeribacter aerolatus]GEO05862.1 bifunctional TolB-family protein/amidohydrolase [Adhaeribacter aerolatus]